MILFYKLEIFQKKKSLEWNDFPERLTKDFEKKDFKEIGVCLHLED